MARAGCYVLGHILPLSALLVAVNPPLLNLTSPFVLAVLLLLGGLFGLTLGTFRRASAITAGTDGTWKCCLILVTIALLPYLFLGGLLVGSPLLNSRVLKLFLLSAITPLLVVAIWSVAPGALHHRVRPRRLLCIITYHGLLVGVAIVGTNLVMGPPVTGTPSIMSPDGSYWYFTPGTVTSVNGIALRFNSFGFRGPEPGARRAGIIKVLVIGDSLPFGGDQPEEKTFPQLAESLINENPVGSIKIEIMNAAMPSFSVEQIRNFYLRHLAPLPHDIVVLCFYIDDVNRELRYKKNAILYTPSWPAWIQDMYYSSRTGHMLMTVLGFRDTTFLFYRRHSLEAAWPGALEAVEAIRQEARKRGATLGILNIPAFNWSAETRSASEYRYVDRNRELAGWAARHRVAYRDTLDALLDRKIDSLRNSPTDIHFSEGGHALMADELKAFLIPLAKAR